MQTEEPIPINVLTLAGDFDTSLATTELRLADGRVLRLPTQTLQQAAAPPAEVSPEEAVADDAEIVLSLAEEQLQVTRQVVETGKVQLHTSVEMYEATVDEPLAVSTYSVDRFAKDEVVAEAPPTRHEGETTIYSVLEERLVVSRQLVLIEEVHVTHRVSERHDPQTVKLRRETLEIERQSSSQR